MATTDRGVPKLASETLQRKRTTLNKQERRVSILDKSQQIQDLMGEEEPRRPHLGSVTFQGGVWNDSFTMLCILCTR